MRGNHPLSLGLISRSVCSADIGSIFHRGTTTSELWPRHFDLPRTGFLVCWLHCLRGYFADPDPAHLLDLKDNLKLPF